MELSTPGYSLQCNICNVNMRILQWSQHAKLLRSSNAFESWAHMDSHICNIWPMTSFHVKSSTCNSWVLYTPAAITDSSSQSSHVVMKCHFSEHVKAMHEKKDSGFEKEFQVCLACQMNPLNSTDLTLLSSINVSPYFADHCNCSWWPYGYCQG